MFKSIYDGYQVSPEGLVLGRRGQPLSQHDNGRGYLIVRLLINGKQTSKGVHRLVAEAFLVNEGNLSDVNHKDCNRYNNNVSNLEWITHGENIKYSYATNNRSATGESNARCQTNEDTVTGICQLLEAGYSPAVVRDMGYDYRLVRAIKARQNWKHISVNYKF